MCNVSAFLGEVLRAVLGSPFGLGFNRDVDVLEEPRIVLERRFGGTLFCEQGFFQTLLLGRDFLVQVQVDKSKVWQAEESLQRDVLDARTLEVRDGAYRIRKVRSLHVGHRGSVSSLDEVP